MSKLNKKKKKKILKLRNENVKITTLKDTCKCFEEMFGRKNFYDLSMEIKEKYPLHASIILLATWNIGRFRFVLNNAKDFLNNLKKTIDECKPLFEKIKDKNFLTADFDEIKHIVKQIYENLSKIRGIEYTGASKLMHLFNKNLFVMWDDTIRRKLGYGTSADEYLNFLKCMQQKFKSIEWSSNEKTLAKAIDEYNYVTFTLPEKSVKKNKRIRKNFD